MTTPTDAPRKRRSREETRAKLLAAAYQVFAHNGYERATVDEIVREAGFSKGAFYVHFESKDDLFWQMLDERTNSQQEVFRQALDPNETVEENERRILETIFSLNDDPLAAAVFLEFSAHAVRNDRVRERLSEMYRKWHAFVLEMLDAGHASGRIRDDVDRGLLASALMAILEGAMIQSRLAPEELRLNQRVNEFARLLATFVAKRD